MQAKAGEEKYYPGKHGNGTPKHNANAAFLGKDSNNKEAHRGKLLEMNICPCDFLDKIQMLKCCMFLFRAPSGAIKLWVQCQLLLCSACLSCSGKEVDL